MRCARPRARSNSSKWSRPRKPGSASRSISTSRRAASESVALADALGRVLAADVAAPVDVPPFDRSGVDGFALRAADSTGASDTAPRRLLLNREVIACGHAPAIAVAPGTATAIATGGVIPRGADAVVMIEQTELLDDAKSPGVEIRRAAAPGQFIAYAGSDIARGETLLRKGALLGSREIGMLAACGIASVDVMRKPRVAVLSTGDELVQPGETAASGRDLRLQRRHRCGSRERSRRRTGRLWRLPGRRGGARARRCARRSPNATCWCCRAAPRKARAISRIPSSRSSASPAFWCMAWR